MYNFVLKERERERDDCNAWVQTFFEGEFLFQFKALKKGNHSAASYLVFQVYLRFFKDQNIKKYMVEKTLILFSGQAPSMLHWLS